MPDVNAESPSGGVGLEAARHSKYRHASLPLAIIVVLPLVHVVVNALRLRPVSRHTHQKETVPKARITSGVFTAILCAAQ